MSENAFYRAKCLLTSFNIVLIAVGLLLIVSGIWIYETSAVQAYSGDISSAIVSKSVVAILIIGYSILIVGVIGYRGSDENSRCFLGNYTLILSVIFVTGIVLGTSVISDYAKVKEIFRDSIHYYNKNSAKAQAISSTWITIQEIFQCCGIKGIKDWTKNGVKYPPPPCRDPNIMGCEDALKPYIVVIKFILIVVYLLQFLSILLAIYLFWVSSKYGD